MAESDSLNANSDTQEAKLDAATVLTTGAALLEHLQRSGVQMLPRANTQRTAVWQDQLSVDLPPIALTPATAKPSSPVPAPAKPGKSRQESSPSVRSTPVASVGASSNPYPGTSLPVAERQEALQVMAQSVAACTQCDALVACRTQTVFGEGNPQPRFVFFGEGPGAEEDKTGRPFVGRAGQLLTKMIQACKLEREDVYILNTVKCRPPGNRNPDPTEIANCRQHFEAQLQLLRPEYIVCLGAVSSQA